MKVGDKVRILADVYVFDAPAGSTGTITEVMWEEEGTTMFGVVIDNVVEAGGDVWAFDNNELEVI